MPGEWTFPKWPNFSFAGNVWLLRWVIQECCRLGVVIKGSSLVFIGVESRYSRDLYKTMTHFMDNKLSRRLQLDRWPPALKILKRR